MPHDPILPGERFPDLAWPSVAGDGVAPASGTGWRLLVVYRGRHCGLCKRYFATLDGLLEEFAAMGIRVMAVSADSAEKAAADVAEGGWRFPVGYDLNVAEMRWLGLHVSDPRTPQQADGPFAEPGLFLINPDGCVQVMDVSNAPYARPDLTLFLAGLRVVQERAYVPHGLNRALA